MWGFKWEKETKWTHIYKGTKPWCLNSCLCRKSKEIGGTESSDQVLGRKRLTLKLNQCSVFVQRLSMVKRGFLIKKHMAHWRNIIKDKTFLISIFNSCLSSYSCLNVSFKMFNFIFFEFFFSWLKIQNQFYCCRKTTDCFLETTDCFVSDSTVKGMDLILFEFLSLADQIYERIVEPSGVQALKNPNPLKDVEALIVLAIVVLV